MRVSSSRIRLRDAAEDEAVEVKMSYSSQLNSSFPEFFERLLLFLLLFAKIDSSLHLKKDIQLYYTSILISLQYYFKIKCNVKIHINRFSSPDKARLRKIFGDYLTSVKLFVVI